MGKLNRVLSACGVGVLLLASEIASAGVVLNEGFEGGIPANWVVQPTVTPLAPINWQKAPDASVFAAQAGTASSYAYNSFNSTPTDPNTGAISDFLITPLLTVNNGTTLSFYVKASSVGEAAFPDRLQVLFSSTGGSTPASFSRVLLDLNPTYSPTDFPTDWSLRTVTLTGLAGLTNGRFAFDYLINNPATQGNYIGLDSVTVTVVPEPDTTLLLAIGLVGLGLGARRARSGTVRSS